MPNALTLLRLALIPVFLFLLFTGKFSHAAVVYLIAILTDLDGAIARKYRVTSHFGAIADPTVDGIFMVTGLGSLVMLGRAPVLPVAAYFVSVLFRLVPSILHLKTTRSVQTTRLSKTIAFCGFSSVFAATIGAPFWLTAAILLLGFGANVLLTLYWMRRGHFRL